MPRPPSHQPQRDISKPKSRYYEYQVCRVCGATRRVDYTEKHDYPGPWWIGLEKRRFCTRGEAAPEGGT